MARPKARASQLRTESYIDFLRGVTGCSAYAFGTDQHRVFSATHMDARARILVYGEPLVIDALAKFWDLGAGFDTPERQEAFVKVIQMMRLASGHGEMSAQTVKSVLLENVDVIRERKAGRTFR